MNSLPAPCVSYTDDCMAKPNMDGRINTTSAFPSSGAGETLVFTICVDVATQPPISTSAHAAKAARTRRFIVYPLDDDLVGRMPASVALECNRGIIVA